MSRFNNAEAVNVRLKALIYGQTGTGKTYTALQFPNPAVVDGERGTEHYAKVFNFQVDRTSKVADLMADINALITDPGPIKTLVVDPITVFMDNLVIEYSKKLKLKKGPDYELTPADHGPLKNMRKEIIDRLLSLDMNIVCTARAKNKYKQDGKNFLASDGLQPDVPGEVPFMFDTIIRIELAPDGVTRLAYCEKDRTNKLPKMFEFTYDAMVNYMGIEGLERDVNVEEAHQRLEEAAGRTFEIQYNGKTVRTAGITAETLDKILAAAKSSNLSQEGLKALLSDSYSCGSLFELKEDEGKYIIKTIENM